MNYCNKRSSPSSSPESSSIMPSTNKWLRLDGTMIDNENIPARAEMTTVESSSSEVGDAPVASNISCGQAAAESSSSLSIIDNIIFPSDTTLKQMVRQQPHTLSNNTEAAAVQPQAKETPSITVVPSSAAVAALHCNKKSMVQSPNDFFTSRLQSRGYPAKTFCSLKSGYHSTPTVS